MSTHPAAVTADRILRHCYEYADRLDAEELAALTDARDTLIGIAWEDRELARREPEPGELALF
jgi:hypothetical protein